MARLLAIGILAATVLAGAGTPALSQGTTSTYTDVSACKFKLLHPDGDYYALICRGPGGAVLRLFVLGDRGCAAFGKDTSYCVPGNERLMPLRAENEFGPKIQWVKGSTGKACAAVVRLHAYPSGSELWAVGNGRRMATKSNDAATAAAIRFCK